MRYIINPGRYLIDKGIFLIIIAPFLFWLFYRYFNLDFWYDEAYTLVHFAFVPFEKTVTFYPTPNNHVFFNLLNNIYLRILGISDIYTLMDSPYKIRFLTLIYTVITLIYLYLIGRKFFGNFVANLTVIMLVTTVPFYNFALQIRGYMLSIMLLCMMVYHLWSFEKELKWLDAILIVLFACLAFYTIPSNLYFLMAIMIFYFSAGVYQQINLAAKKQIIEPGSKSPILPQFIPSPDFYDRYKQFIIVFLIGLGLIIAGLFYLPILEQVINNKFVKSQGFFNADTLLKMMPQSFDYFVSERYLLVPVLVIGLLGYVLFCKTKNKEFLYRTAFCLFLLFAPFVLSFIRGDQPFDRVFVNLTPVFALLVAISIYFLHVIVRPLHSKTLLTTFVMIFYCNFTFTLAMNNIEVYLKADIEQNRKSQDMYYNYYQAHYHPLKTLDDFVQNNKTDSIPVMVYEFDEEAMPKYLEKFQIRYSKIWNLKPSPGPPAQEMYIITAYPYSVGATITYNYPQVHCKILNKELAFHNILFCRTEKNDTSF